MNAMNCPDCAALLGAYSDGELDVVNALTIEEHVKSCATCSAELGQTKAIHDALLNPQLAYKAPASLRRTIIATARQEVRERETRQWRFNLPSFFAGAISAAAVLVCGLLAFNGGQMESNELVAAHVRSLQADHLTDVLSSDSHTVKPWFTGRIDFTAPVKDLASEGFPLVGGRLDYIEKRPAIALVYKRNQHVINVFIQPTERGNSAATSLTTKRGFSIVHTKSNGLEFSAISDLNSDELERLVSLLTR